MFEKIKNMDVVKVHFPIGSVVKLAWDEVLGEVVGYNQVENNLYPSDEYPLLVAWADGRGTYEYHPDGVELIKRGRGAASLENDYRAVPGGIIGMMESCAKYPDLVRSAFNAIRECTAAA